MSYNTSFFGGGSGGGGGVTTFTGLTDTPASYSGQSGKVVKVNGAENALIFEEGGNTTPIDSAYENVAALVAATEISSGDIVATYGYHALSDGGQMVYTVTDTDLSGDVDGGSVIALANSLYAQAQFPDVYRPEMWGAKHTGNAADASTNVTALNAMFLYCNDSNIKPMVFSAGTYYINDTCYLPVKQANYQWRYYGNGCTIRTTGRNTTTTANWTIETGVRTVTVEDETGFAVGEQVRLLPLSDNIALGGGVHNFMQGEITAISGRDLTVDVTETRLFEKLWQTTIDLDSLGATKNLSGAGNWQGFVVGQTLRFEYDASNYFTADVTFYQSTGNLGLNNIVVTGSGSYDRWKVTVTAMSYFGTWRVKGGIEMFKRLIPNQTYADGAVSSKVQFDGFNFSGSGADGLDIGIAYACAYGSSITNMTFRDCYKGWWGQFMLMTYYANIMLYCDIGMDCTYGYEFGGTPALAASNVATMDNIRSFASQGAKASIRVLGSNSYYLLNLIEEGYPKQYGIWWDAVGSTNTINLRLEEVHLEVSDIDSFIRVDRIQVVRITIDGIYPQYGNIIVNNTDDNSPAYLTLRAYYWIALTYLYRGYVDVYHEVPSAAYPSASGFGSGKNTWPDDLGRVGTIYGTGTTQPTFGVGEVTYNFGTGSLTGNGLSGVGGGNSYYAAQNLFAIGGDSAILHIRGRSNHFWGDGAPISKGSLFPMDIVHSGTTNPQPLRIYSGTTTAANLRWYRSSGTRTYYNDNSYFDPANATQLWSIPNTAGQAGQVLKHDGVADMNWADISSADIGIYPTVSALVSATDYASGDVVQTQGYNAENDGGQNTYTVTDTDLSASVDGGSVIDLGGGLYAEADFGEFYAPEMWGAKADNSTASADINVTAFTAMFAYMARNNKRVEFATGTYYLNESVTMLAPLPFEQNYVNGFYTLNGNGATIRSTGRSTTSATSLTFTTGVKTLTVGSGQRFQEGEKICISHKGNRMMAVVNSYSGTTLEAEVYQTDGFQHSIYRSSVCNTRVGDTSTISVSNNHLFFAGQEVVITTDYQVECIATVNSTASTTINITITANNSYVLESTDSKTIASSGNLSINTDLYQVSRKMVVGSRLRVTSVADPNAWMEGEYTGGTSNTNLNITLDTSNGSGTFADWQITVEQVPNFDLTTRVGFTNASWGVRGGITMLDRSCNVRTTSKKNLQANYVSASTTSMTPTSGSFTFTADDPVIAQDFVGYVVSITAPNGAYAFGIVTAYNQSTGETTANITSTYALATRDDWSISYSQTLRDDTASFTLSTTTLTLGKGTQNLTVTPYGFDVTGYWVNIMYKEGNSTSNDRTYDKCMYGTITAYDDGTGAMTVDVSGNNTTNTYSSWVVMANPIDPVVQFGFDDILPNDYANYAIYFDGVQGDYFNEPSGNKKEDVSIDLRGYILSYDSTTGNADVLLTGATGFRAWTYWGVSLNGPDRDNSFISDRSIGAKFDINNLNFSGQGDTSMDIGLKWSNSYGSSMRRCSFGSAFIGFYGLFNLMGSLEDINTFSCGWGVWGRTGDWGDNNTQCNVYYLRNNRFYGSTSGLGSTRTTRSNAWTIVKYIHEGAPSRHGIFLDARGDTTVKNFALDFLHLEVTLFRSFLYIPNGGQINKVTFSNNFSQHKNIDYEGTTNALFYNKIYNVGGSIVRPTGERFAVSGDENKFPVGESISYWRRQFPFYTKALSMNSLGTVDVAGGITFSGTLDGTTSGLVSIGSGTTVRGSYYTSIGQTGGIGTTITGGWGYFRSYVNVGMEMVSTSSFGLKLRSETGAQFFIQQNGISTAGSTVRRIVVTDYAASVTQYMLPTHTASSNGQVWKFDNTSGNPLMEWGFVDFLELGDVSDSSYTGLAGAIPTVNATETGMELVAPADTGEVLKSTATGATYGNVFGQIISLTYDTTTATVSIPTGGGLRPLTYSINFKATATTMLIELQCYIAVAAGETITAGLSDNPSTFNDVGTTTLGLATNAVSGATTLSLVKTWYVTGLTIGTSYVWYPSVESTGASSTIRVGVGVSPFVIKAIHGAA